MTSKEGTNNNIRDKIDAVFAKNPTCILDVFITDCFSINHSV